MGYLRTYIDLTTLISKLKYIEPMMEFVFHASDVVNDFESLRVPVVVAGHLALAMMKHAHGTITDIHIVIMTDTPAETIQHLIATFPEKYTVVHENSRQSGNKFILSNDRGSTLVSVAFVPCNSPIHPVLKRDWHEVLGVPVLQNVELLRMVRSILE
ncbi:hypothetical protein EJ06DRAFT_529961 [Trichodelitschia bisporula]|uniref:Uncharacterized protein n=1 Tax=Trichodelitschia bisporula TaxID=703511 RepID=A0A6G1HXT7_9PEZI|nr:hypothetical protein EJ06DRAFT_529961 [Trichodelitschia bisporula]